MTVAAFPQRNPQGEQALERALLAAEVRFLQALQDYAKIAPGPASNRLAEHIQGSCRVMREAIQGVPVA